MPSQHAIEVFAFLNFAIVGLSLLLRPGAWVQFFLWMRREGEAGAMIYGLLCVLWGSLIVSFHPDWHGILVVLPLFGVVQLFEGIIFLLFPGAGLRLMAVFGGRTPLIRLLGLIALALAVCIFVILLPVAA
jgi:hypothetical protein